MHSDLPCKQLLLWGIDSVRRRGLLLGRLEFAALPALFFLPATVLSYSSVLFNMIFRVFMALFLDASREVAADSHSIEGRVIADTG